MIKRLIDFEILNVDRYTKKVIEDIPNMELSLNPKKIDFDEQHLTRIKLK